MWQKIFEIHKSNDKSREHFKNICKVSQASNFLENNWALKMFRSNILKNALDICSILSGKYIFQFEANKVTEKIFFC